MTPEQTAEAKAALSDRFPNWSIIQSDRGRWWATRGPLSRDRAHLRADADADTPAELGAMLAQIEADGSGREHGL
ncbi:hypothetical protein [Actinomadura macrotermitis]|uniref:Uncharacterized protein n=1 Tax=Actinomadura macrotermitis TaxID=2585200 RepID=A0A7K0BRD4_9ACTN|nr:hypothetical protein [Actinomadura macrotermitis]MQY03586.1 hypothetical protein [Actinomadura macrotermitis]